MAVFLSPVFGVAGQVFDDNGNPLAGGKIYTYLAGTTTPAATYTTSLGSIAHTNPIVLDGAGRVPSGEIWLTDGIVYKFVVEDANSVLIGTYDNLTGINSNFVAFTNEQEIQTATAGQTVFNLTTVTYQPGTNSLSVFVDGVNQYGPGAQYAYVETDSNTVTFVSGLHVGASVKFTTSQLNTSGAVDASQVTYDPPFANSVVTNVEDKLAQTISVMDFGVVGDGSDETTKLQAAFNAVTTGVRLSLSGLTVVTNESVAITNQSDFIIDGEGGTIIAKNGMPVISGRSLILLTNCENFKVENITFDGNRANRTPAEVPAHSVTVISCRKFIFENVYSNNAVVDGYYFATPTNTIPSTYCLNFLMIGCYADNCYRQGASVINGYDFQFIGGAYTNSNGTAPEAGIDVESNAGATVGNTRGLFTGVTFSGNNGFGLVLSSVAGSKTFTVQSCNFSQNASGGLNIFTDQTNVRDSYFSDHSGVGVTQGVARFAPASTIKSGSIVGCTFENNTSTTGDIYTHSLTSGIRVYGNRIINSGGAGIVLAGTNQVCSDNIISGCAGVGIDNSAINGVLQNNTIDSCVGRGIYSAGTRSRILFNNISNISSVSGAYIQAAGTDPLVVGNVCSSTGAVSDLGIRIDNTAIAVYSNICVNLNSTNSYSFIGSAFDDMVYNNIGGTANDRRSVRFGMAVPSYTTGARPAANTVAAGQTIFNTTTNKLNTSNGTTNWYNADGTVA